jgi:hypothetical protein
VSPRCPHLRTQACLSRHDVKLLQAICSREIITCGLDTKAGKDASALLAKLKLKVTKPKLEGKR